MARFSTIVQKQQVSHCGPTSLSSCLGLLGIEVSQADVRRAAGKGFLTVLRHGLDEHDLKDAGKRLGAVCTFVRERTKAGGERFIRQLEQRLGQGLPLVLSVWDARHWVALLSKDADGRFIVMDPNDDESSVERWSAKRLLRESWCASDKERFAIVVRRTDGQPARWRMTRDFIHLLERGSEQRARTWLADLEELARRAETGRKPATREPLARALARIEKTVIESVLHWTHPAVVVARKSDIRDVYRDCLVIADAASLVVQKNLDVAALAAQMTSLVSVFAQQGSLG